MRGERLRGDSYAAGRGGGQASENRTRRASEGDHPRRGLAV